MALRTSRLCAVLFASLACRFFLTWSFPALTSLWQHHFLPCELVYFLAGALSYRAFDAQRALGKLPAMAARGRSVMPALLVLFFAYPLLPTGFRGLLAAAALALALPFVFALTAGMKADRVLGELSYPLYIVHWNLAHAWSLLVREGWLPNFRQDWVATLVFMLAALLAAAVLALVVEVPVNRYRERRRLARLVPSPA